MTDREVVISHVYNAPRELVFNAWTVPEQLKKWWAPKGCTLLHCTVDLRVGGLFLFCMGIPDGREVWARGIYQEILFPERIVYLDSFADKTGRKVEPSDLGFSPQNPSESLVTVTFTAMGSKTRVELRHTVPSTSPERADMVQGWCEMFDKLADIL
ncbi:MAG: SRPBCC domain-containing protein [candidate division Zixibacteria bacterium]|nr:SRPBCC domain-containing protein [candidate division Zixibacteria bacterium]